ncbi:MULTISPECIES: hypothetical protein [unclassified Streptomyces]|uniref:hypothetical protein n=1 Tax=unclassified Streptomyces TaxID=2593676 RepID=UPI002E81E8F6|nr:hypothetical protein [Streptomyces sp. NBC_00562]WUC19674.1 hypothetical protein OHA33_12785 [Streptomyces sp. NBC_00562]
MTLVQVKRPDRRLDTAEVIPTVTREVDAEGVRKAYRGDDAPTKEKDLVRRQEDQAGRKSGRRRRDHRACGMAPGARGTTTTQQLLGAMPAIPSGDPCQGLVAPARQGSNDPSEGLS